MRRLQLLVCEAAGIWHAGGKTVLHQAAMCLAAASMPKAGCQLLQPSLEPGCCLDTPTPAPAQLNQAEPAPAALS
eukprot:354395-Chlamydomonas_euryale.AAC.4